MSQKLHPSYPKPYLISSSLEIFMKTVMIRLVVISVTLFMTACSTFQDQLSSLMGDKRSNTSSEPYSNENTYRSRHENKNTPSQQNMNSNPNSMTPQDSDNMNPSMDNSQLPAVDANNPGVNANPNAPLNPPASQSQNINLAPSAAPTAQPIQAPAAPVPSNQTINPNKKDPLTLDMNKMMQPLGATTMTPVAD